MSEAKKPTKKPSERAREIAPPADRKPTAQTEAAEVKTYEVTVLGEVWEVAAERLDDFELLEKISLLDAGGPGAAGAAPSVLRGLLGPAQFARAMELIRDRDTGRVSVAAGIEFVRDLFAELNPNS